MSDQTSPSCESAIMQLRTLFGDNRRFSVYSPAGLLLLVADGLGYFAEILELEESEEFQEKVLRLWKEFHPQEQIIEKQILEEGFCLDFFYPEENDDDYRDALVTLMVSSSKWKNEKKWFDRMFHFPYFTGDPLVVVHGSGAYYLICVSNRYENCVEIYCSQSIKNEREEIDDQFEFSDAIWARNLEVKDSWDNLSETWNKIVRLILTSEEYFQGLQSLRTIPL